MKNSHNLLFSLKSIFLPILNYPIISSLNSLKLDVAVRLLKFLKTNQLFSIFNDKYLAFL